MGTDVGSTMMSLLIPTNVQRHTVVGLVLQHTYTERRHSDRYSFNSF